MINVRVIALFRIPFIIFMLFLISSCLHRGANRAPKEEQDSISNNDSILKYSPPPLVSIDSKSYSGLTLYYPSVESIGFFVGNEPDTTITTICFCCAASYTLSKHHHGLHSDVAGTHVLNGVVYQGYECENNTGGFVYYGYPNMKWEILNKSEYLSRLNSDSLPTIAFTQELLIRNGQKQDFVRKDNYLKYRALCILNGRLCIIDGSHKHMLTSFIDMLLNIGVSDALYLDMGGLSYSWYRNYPDDDNRSKVIVINSKPQSYYGSNWLIFFWVN